MTTKIDVDVLDLNSIAWRLRDAAGVDEFLLDLQAHLAEGQPFPTALEAAVARLKDPWAIDGIGVAIGNVYRGRAYGTLGEHEARLVLEALAAWIRAHGCRLIVDAAELEAEAREVGTPPRPPIEY